MTGTNLTTGRVEKIWQLQVPLGNEFAEMRSLHVPPDPAAASQCPACGARRWNPPPLTVEWEEGSDEVADFVSAVARIVVRVSVADELLARFHGFEKGPVIMSDHPKLHRPARVTKRTRPRVWLPYQGPDLCELLVTRELPLLPESTVTVESMCSACGRVVYGAVEGCEQKNSRSHVCRQPGKGFFFSHALLTTDGFFRPQWMWYILCTGPVKEFIEARGFTNIEFLQAGDAV